VVSFISRGQVKELRERNAVVNFKELMERNKKKQEGMNMATTQDFIAQVTKEALAG
jgi:hypothetical protein